MIQGNQTHPARNYASIVSNNKLYVTPTTFDGTDYDNKFQLLKLASERKELMGPFETQEQADDAMYRLANRSRARAGLDPIDQPRTPEQSIIANTTEEYKGRLQESRSYWVDKPRVDGTYTTQLRGADQPKTPEEIELERDEKISSRVEALRFTEFKLRARRNRKNAGLPTMSDEELEQSYSAINRARQMAEFNDVLRGLGREPVSYEELETKIGFWEGVGSSAGYFGEGFLPFVGGIEESFELAGVLTAAKAINDGTATEEERKRLEDWWVETQINALRGNNWGGTVGKIVGQLPAFGGEIALTGGVYSLGRAAARKTITEAIESIGGKAAKDMLMSRAAVSVAGGVTGATRQATFAGALSGRWTAAAFQEIMPEMSLSEDEAGELAITIDGTDMTAGNAIFRGWASQVREYGTERLGWMVGTKGLGQLIGKFPIADQVRAWKSVIAKKWLTGGAGRTVRGFDETLKKMGWNGVLGEMFEERAGELVDVPIDAMTLGELSYALPDFEQLSAEFVAFLVPGATRSALGNVGEVANYSQARRQGVDYIEKRTKQLEGQVAAAERQEVTEAEAVAEVAEVAEPVEPADEVEALEPGEQMTMFAPPASEAETQEVLPEAEPEIQGELDKVAEEMDRSDERGVSHRIRVVPEDRQSPATRALVEVVGRSGVRVVPVDITTEEGEVASRGGFVGSDARTVYVQEVPAGANSEQTQDVVASNVRAVVMHEVTHTLERENPSLFNALINLMPAQVQRGIEDYRVREEALGGTEISTAERDENYVKLVSEGMAMVLMSASESGSIIMTDPASRSLLERLQAFIRRVAVKLRLPGQENAWIQNVVDQILEGKDVSEITLPGQERILRTAERRGRAPLPSVTEEEAGAEPDLTTQFAPRREGEMPLVYTGRAADLSPVQEPTENEGRFMSEFEDITFPSSQSGINFPGRLFLDPNAPSDVVERFGESGALPNDFDHMVGVVNVSSQGGGSVRLSSIASLQKGSGQGTAMLKILTGLADKHGVSIRGDVSKFGDKGLSQDKLREWYSRHGFEVSETDAMVYPAKGDIQFAPPVNTPEFRRWFKDSKVVDEQGNPLVVYKGMPTVDFGTGEAISVINRDTEFPAFYKDETGINIAGFFARDPAVASYFSTKYTKGAEAAGVYPVYLSLQNPYVVDAQGEPAGKIQFEESGLPFRNAMKSGAYDGAIILNTIEPGSETPSDVYIANKPNQIKSAIGNVGTFDPAQEDIRFAPPVNTPEFRRWFKDSKVVDEQGEPLVMYHGTTGESFSEFKLDLFGGNEQFGPGHYFARYPETANAYTSRADKFGNLTGRERIGGRIYPVYLSIQNPIRINLAESHTSSVTGRTATVVKGLSEIEYPEMTRDQIREMVRRIPAETRDDTLSNWGDVEYEGEAAVIETVVDAYSDNPAAFTQMGNDLFDGRTTDFLRAYKEVTGYDGVVVQDFASAGGIKSNLVVVAFESSQIKSATGNVGTFDPSQADIRFAPAGLPLTIQDVSSGIESEPGTVLAEDVDSEDLVRALEGGVQFAPSGSFAKIPRVPPSFFANKKAFVYFADRMKIGRYKGIDPKSGIDIELQGGPGYPHARGNKRKAGWAFTDKGMVTRFNNKISESDGIGIVALFGSGNVRGNATFLKAWIAETKYAVSSKKLDRSYAFAELNLVREQALNTKGFERINAPWVDKWRSEWTTFPQVERALKAATFEVRNTAFFGWNPDKKGSNKGSKIGSDDRIAKGFPNLTEMVRLMEDPSFDGLPYGAVVSAVDFGKAPLKPTTAKKLGIKEHLSYPVVVKGNGVGVLERTVDILDVYDPGKEDRARSLRSVSTSMAVVEGSAIAEQMQQREAEGDPKFAPRPETPEQRAERLARQAAKREQERQAVQAGAPITTPERQRAARRIIKEQVDEARKEGRAAGLETGYKHAREIAEGQIQRLKDKKASVERIKGDVLKYFNRVFKGRNMESAGLKDIKKLMNLVANANTEASLTKALDEIALVSVDLRLKEAKKKAGSAIKKVKKASPLPQEYRKQLDDGVESLTDARSQKPTTTRSKIKNTEDLVEGTESLLGILNEARSAKKEIVLQRKMTEEEAIESIAGEIAEGKDEIPGLDEMGGVKEAKGSRRSTVWKWHQDMKSLIQSITGKIKSNLSELLVTNFRIAEDNYNARLKEVLDLAESAARDAGFNSLEEAMVKLSGSQGMSLVDMIVVELGGRNVEITPAEAMHLILMDPMTRSLIDGGTPVEIKRADGSQIPASITTEEIDAIREQMDPRLVAFADRMKDILETEIKPGMFQAVRNITGAEPESVPDYWPRSRSRDSKTEMSMDDFLNGTGNAGQLMTMYLENMGVTKSRVQDKTTPIYIKSALQTFVEHVDTGLRIENLAEQVRLADKVLRNDVIAREIKRRHGIQTYRMLREYIASTSGVRDAFKGGFDRAAGLAQSNAAVSYLLLNPRTWLVQLTSIPRFVNQFSIQDIAAGIAWMTQNIGNLREIMSTESGYFWRRWARSSAERFGPQKYGQMVPFDKEGFSRGVSNTASNLMRGNLGDAYRSWSSAVDSLQFLDGFDAMVAGVAYGAARSQLQRQGVTGQELDELAASNAADAMRDTQNSTSTLDLTMGALAGRQSAIARMFLMFSSDPLKTTNIIMQASREIKEGNVLSGSTKIAGVISSMLLATSLRVGYYGAMGAAIAAIGGSDDDQKKAERTAENVDNIYRGLVRELSGLTFFGPLIEMGYDGLFGEFGVRADVMDSPVSSIIKGMVRATSNLATAIADLSDVEVDQAVEKLLLAMAKAGNEISSAVVGNPFRPWINDALKFGDGLLVQDPVQDLRALDKFYKEMDPKDLSNQQKRYFGRVRGFLKGIRDFDSAISKQKKVYEIILQTGQEDRIESARQALLDLRRRRSELAARALSEISPSDE